MTSTKNWQQVRVLYPLRYWTPVRKEVFTDVFPQLDQRRAAHLYLLLYDKCCRESAHQVSATVRAIAKWAGLNERTVRHCMDELKAKGLVTLMKKGHLRSRSDAPLWKVPLADFNFREQGPWTPVPTFVLYRYFSAYGNSVLLPVLLWHQHIGWGNWCWPGVPRLAKLLHWSQPRVYGALRTMGDEERWNGLGTGLPWPLEIKWRSRKDGHGYNRHFHVRGLDYRKQSGRSVVGLDMEFAQFFGVPELKRERAGAVKAVGGKVGYRPLESTTIDNGGR